MQEKFNQISWTDVLLELLLMTFGACIYAFGVVFFNMYNHLADGGVTGITLILRALFHIDPAYSTILVNIPLFLLGYRYLSKKDMFYTIYGTFALSIFLWIWQRVPITININHDLLLAAIGAGLLGGFGSGIIYRCGGTTGGIDIVAQLYKRFRGVQMGQTLLVIGIGILLSSLVYLNIREVAYTLIYVWIFTLIVNLTQQGAYTARGILIISNKSSEIANHLMNKLQRGVTYLNAEGGYSHNPKRVIYCVVSPSELHTVKQLVEDIDDEAFISIINVHEAIGEGFTYKKPNKFKLFL